MQDLQAWRQVSRAYYDHAAGCRTCVAAGQLVSGTPRCPEGAVLWQAYQDHPLPSMLHGRAEKVAKTVAKNVAQRGGRLDAWEYM